MPINPEYKETVEVTGTKSASESKTMRNVWLSIFMSVLAILAGVLPEIVLSVAAFVPSWAAPVLSALAAAAAKWAGDGRKRIGDIK